MNVLDVLGAASSVYTLKPLIDQLRMLDQKRVFINCISKHVKLVGRHLPDNSINLNKIRFAKELDTNDITDVELKRLATLPASSVRSISSKLTTILLDRTIVEGVDPVFFDKDRAELVIDRARRSFVTELFKALPEEILFEKLEHTQVEDVETRRIIKGIENELKQIQRELQVEKLDPSIISNESTDQSTEDTSKFLLKVILVSAAAGAAVGASTAIVVEFSRRYRYVDMDEVLSDDNSSEEDSKVWFQFLGNDDPEENEDEHEETTDHEDSDQENEQGDSFFIDL